MDSGVGTGPAGRWAVVLVVAALGAAGCGGGPKVCTLIGADTGVAVTYRVSEFTAGGPVTVSLCADEVCEERPEGSRTEGSRTEGSRAEAGRIFVRLPVEVGPKQVAVRFRVTRMDSGGGGDVVLEDRVTTRLRKNQPNGEGCGDPAWSRALTATSRGLGAE